MRSPWARLSTRERAIFCLTAAVVGAALFRLFVVRPYEASLDMIKAEIDAKEIRLARAELAASKSSMKRPIRIAPLGSSEQEMSRLLKAIESMARESSVRITDLKPISAEGKADARKYRIELQSQATMDETSRFLYKLQTSPLALSVPRFSLSAPEAPGERKLKLSMTIASSVGS